MLLSLSRPVCVGETFRLACDSDFLSPKGAQISFHILYRLNMSCALGCGSITVPQGQDERVTILTPWQSQTEKHTHIHRHLSLERNVSVSICIQQCDSFLRLWKCWLMSNAWTQGNNARILMSGHINFSLYYFQSQTIYVLKLKCLIFIFKKWSFIGYANRHSVPDHMVVEP